MNRFEILTIFPEVFSGFLSSSLIKKAIDRKLIEITLTQIRDFADPPHYHVDDTPYGGGAGMVMRPEPLSRAIEAAKKRLPNALVILLSPAGNSFEQARAQALSRQENLILICGRYEGIDQRVVDLYVDEEISIGDYVLMGGEVPAMVLLESISRLVDDVVGNSESTIFESFSADEGGAMHLEAPHYTRPPEFGGLGVPDVLLSGNHAEIAAWRKRESLRLTSKRRPNLLSRGKS